MELYFCGHDHVYQIQSLMMMFFPFEKINSTIINQKQSDEIFRNSGKETVVLTKLLKQPTSYKACVSVKYNGSIYERDRFITSNEKNEVNKAFAFLLSEIFSKITDINLPWGIYTGIRPVKTVNNLIDAGLRPEEIEKSLKDDYKISKNRIDLAIKTAYSERRILKQNKENYFSLFVFIPFCPTRCNYCSFVSHSIENANKLLEPYLIKLTEEIKLTGQIAQDLGLVLDTVYIGGGTPTVLNDIQMNYLLTVIEDNFKIRHSTEYTVEAGRADTITKSKLEIMKGHRVNRISINPQSFNNDVLKTIGRSHTSKQVHDAYKIAREVGFDSINMDFIAGLPNDNFDSFKNSLETAVNMDIPPENITIHTLTVKRSASLKENDIDIVKNFESVKNMLDFSQKLLYSNGYIPYYLYRQKNTIGSFENVGYSKEDAFCKYNVLIMEEVQTILACGAGGVTKLCLHDENNKPFIQRIFNYKFPYEYIDNFDEMIKRKKSIYSFYKIKGED